MKKENPAADIQLLEKTIGALYLVESLVKENLEFIFKGGTSLVLLLNEIKRFSVDVDIITDENREQVKEVITNIIEKQDLFTRFEENIRENSASQRMDLQHYKLFFNSVIDYSEKYILLDVAYESNKYPGVIYKDKIDENKDFISYLKENTKNELLLTYLLYGYAGNIEDLVEQITSLQYKRKEELAKKIDNFLQNEISSIIKFLSPKRMQEIKYIANKEELYEFCINRINNVSLDTIKILKQLKFIFCKRENDKIIIHMPRYI